VSYGERVTEKLFFSPYSTKGAQGGAPGFNVGFIGRGTGLKADLQYKDEVLKDVDLKTIYRGKGQTLKAIVMQFDYEERPMTDDEKRKEKESAEIQGRDPIYTKTVKIEKPRQIDFNVGSNNYNIIINQYPGVEAKVLELLQGAIRGKGVVGKSVDASTVKALVGKAGYEGYTEKELMDYYKSQGYTIR